LTVSFYKRGNKDMSIDSKEVPTYEELMWPTIKALNELGGSASNQEILDKIIELENYSEEMQAVPQAGKNNTKSKLEYRAAWTRTNLKAMGIINNSQRGVWVILDKGNSLSEEMIAEKYERLKKYRRDNYINNKFRKDINDETQENLDVNNIEENITWKERLLEKLKSMNPYDFEKLCQLILRESGFSKVTVTKKSGDGGIDGFGNLRLNLISFTVAFQCKKYTDTMVTSSAIRDFRGSIQGRETKGLFITTSNFTSDARAEARRDGAIAIDLIDGDALCELLKTLEVGIKTEMIENVVIDDEWFANF